MKKLIILLLIPFLIMSCKPSVYEIDIKYQDGSEETIKIKEYGYPRLDDGCIEFGNMEGDDALRCGVKSFTYKELPSSEPTVN